jgi:predicted Na+-dependent transporter
MAQQSRLRQLQKFADAQCLPLGLVFSMAFGAFVPAIGVAFSTGDVLAIICVVVIFVVSGLKLKTAEAKEAIAAWQVRAQRATRGVAYS